MSKIWYSFKGVPYLGNCPHIYRLQGKEWYDQLCNSLPEIKNVAIAFLNDGSAPQQSYFNGGMVEGNDWRGVSFLFWGTANKDVQEKGKELFGFFRNIPGLISFSVSILQPGTRIKPHYGDTDAIYRMHIPIAIPAGLPDCGLKVAGKDRAWEENEIIVFCDAYLHEAWNMTQQPRAILIADVVKEEYLNKAKTIRNNVNSLLQLQKLHLKLPFAAAMPWYVIGATRHILLWKIMLTGK